MSGSGEVEDAWSGSYELTTALCENDHVPFYIFIILSFK